MKNNLRINQVEPLLTNSDILAVNKYLKSGGWLTEHNVTKTFENNIAHFVNRKFATAVPNGTIAIYLSLLAAGLGKNDKVAVPNLTMIATINAVLWAGAKPVLVDVDESLCMSPEKLRSIKNLKAVIYVPLNGRTKNGIEISKFCKEKSILLIEDSAHALGSKYFNGKKCGSLGDISIFSFTPHKLITTGQGGMILCDKKSIYNNLQKIKTFNRKKDKQDWHEGFGLNFKITDIQSSLGISQLNRIDEIIKNKLKIFNLYKKINSNKYKLGTYSDYELPWFFEIFSNNKKDTDALFYLLKSNNIEARYFYPALSKQKYLNKVLKTDLNYSEKIFQRLLWLPSSNGLSKKEQTLIVDIINSV